MTEIKITFKKPVALSSEMKESLAHCYQMEGFRKYLENMLNALIVLSAMKSKNEIIGHKLLTIIDPEIINDIKNNNIHDF